MANSYFENSRSFTPGTSADGEEVDDKFDSVESGFEAVEVATNAAIKLTNGDVSGSQVIPADAATRASKVIGFDISGALTLLASGAAWRGDWTAPLLYNINDIVQDAAGAVSQDSLFICVTEHTSSDFAADSANWELMVNVGAVVAAKDAAEAARVAAETAETNAGISEAVAVASGLQAVEAQGYSEEWANKAEDSLVSAAAGGNGVDEYSAKHHALKAAAAVTSHAASTSTHGVSGALVGTTDAQTLTNKTLDAAANTITTAASGNLTSTNLNAALAELQNDIDTRATAAALASEVSDLEAYADAGDAATLAAAEAILADVKVTRTVVPGLSGSSIQFSQNVPAAVTDPFELTIPTNGTIGIRVLQQAIGSGPTPYQSYFLLRIGGVNYNLLSTLGTTRGNTLAAGFSGTANSVVYSNLSVFGFELQPKGNISDMIFVEGLPTGTVSAELMMTNTSGTTNLSYYRGDLLQGLYIVEVLNGD